MKRPRRDVIVQATRYHEYQTTDSIRIPFVRFANTTNRQSRLDQQAPRSAKIRLSIVCDSPLGSNLGSVVATNIGTSAGRQAGIHAVSRICHGDITIRPNRSAIRRWIHYAMWCLVRSRGPRTVGKEGGWNDLRPLSGVRPRTGLTRPKFHVLRPNCR